MRRCGPLLLAVAWTLLLLVGVDLVHPALAFCCATDDHDVHLRDSAGSAGSMIGDETRHGDRHGDGHATHHRAAGTCLCRGVAEPALRAGLLPCGGPPGTAPAAPATGPARGEPPSVFRPPRG